MLYNITVGVISLERREKFRVVIQTLPPLSSSEDRDLRFAQSCTIIWLSSKMSFKTPAYTTLMLHAANKGLTFCTLKILCKFSTSANLVKKGSHIDKNVNLQVWGEFKMLRTKIAWKLTFFIAYIEYWGTFLKSGFQFFLMIHTCLNILVELRWP